MLSGSLKVGKKVLLLLALVSPLALFSTKLLPWGVNSTNTVAMIAQEIIYPFQWVWIQTTDAVENSWNHYVALSNASKENDELRSKLNKLNVELLDYNEKKLELERLRELLGLSKSFDRRHIVAEVINISHDELFHSMRLNKGKLDGIKIGAPVITAKGVVGRIIRVGSKFSDVHLLLDINFNVDSLIQRNRVRTVLNGNTSDTIARLNRKTEVRIGDTIITSGIVGGFPKGLAIGQVTRISYGEDNVNQTISVEPWVDFDRVEEVLVLDYQDKALDRIIETAGSDWFESVFRKEKGRG